MNISQFAIESTLGHQLYGRLGDESTTEMYGKKVKSRLIITFSNTDQGVPAPVYVETIKRGPLGEVKALILSFLRGKFVRYPYKNRAIFININSLSKRMGISKEEIHTHIRKGEFEGLFEREYQRCFEIEEKVELVFRRLIIEHYRTTSPLGQLITNTGETLQITPSELRRMLGIAGYSPVAAEGGPDEVFYGMDKPFTLIPQKSKTRVLHLKRSEAYELPIVNLFTGRVLGMGGFGMVEQVEALTEGRVLAAKVLKKTTPERNKDAIHNEKAILDKIFITNPHARGIQVAPRRILDFSIRFKDNEGGEPSIYYGYLTKKYDSNLSQVLGLHKGDTRSLANEKLLSKQQWIEGVRQLLEGLAELETQQICHGDIKKENILIGKKENGEVDFAIADFGGAVDQTLSTEAPRHHTEFYHSQMDQDLYHILRAQYEFSQPKEEKEEIDRQTKSLLLKRDVYAMGAVFVSLMGKGMVADHFEQECGKNPLRSMTNRMIHENSRERISAGEALKYFNFHYPS